MKHHKSETGAPLIVDCIVLCPHFDDYFFGLLLCVHWQLEQSTATVQFHPTQLHTSTQNHNNNTTELSLT
jgi:hypothetical protein